MTAIRAAWTTSLALFVMLALVPCSPAQSPKVKPIVLPSAATTATPARAAVDEQGQSCVIYGLSEMGDDPNLGAWIAKTMPEVIEPGSWRTPTVGGSGVVSYYAPAKMLVVYQTAAVHAQVDAFLKNVKKTLPQAKAPPLSALAQSAISDRGVVPAQFTVPASNRSVEVGPVAKSAYPIPAPLQQPKHLFHFIIRYEGDGAIDNGVAALAKALTGDASSADEKTDAAKVEPAKPASLSQLFNIILRYEGEGIIDANVAEVIKAFQGDKNSTPAPIIGVPVPSGGVNSESGPATTTPGPTLPNAIPLQTAPRQNQPTGNTNHQPGSTTAPTAPYLTGTSNSSPGGATLPTVPAARAPNASYMPPVEAPPATAPAAKKL